MRKHGVTLKPSEKVKSAIYKELLADAQQRHPGAARCAAFTCAAQLRLERRVARGGRDSIDHTPGGHDDLINAAAGALVLAATQVGARCEIVWGRDRPPGPPSERRQRMEMILARREFGRLLEALTSRPRGDGC